MNQWEYCEVDFDGSISYAWIYDEAGHYIDNPRKHARLGILLAQLGHDGWELVSTWWRSSKEVTYMLKRPSPVDTQEWTPMAREQARQDYIKAHPSDRKFN